MQSQSDQILETNNNNTYIHNIQRAFCWCCCCWI